MICPACRSIYREGVTVCVDCHVALMDVFESDQEPGFQEFVEIMHVFNEGHIPLIKSVFDDAGLQYYFDGESAHLLIPLPLSTRLMIKKDQADEGKRILAELGLT